jgi:hypothetical protein
LRYEEKTNLKFYILKRNKKQIATTKLFIISMTLIITMTGDKLDANDKIFLTFKETSVEGEYVKNKSSLILVDKAEEVDFIFNLSVYAKGLSHQPDCKHTRKFRVSNLCGFAPPRQRRVSEFSPLRREKYDK